MSLDDFAALILLVFKLCIFVYFLGPREELLDRLKGYMMQVNNPFKVPYFIDLCYTVQILCKTLVNKNSSMATLQTGILIGKPAEDSSMSSQVNKENRNKHLTFIYLFVLLELDLIQLLTERLKYHHLAVNQWYT